MTAVRWNVLAPLSPFSAVPGAVIGQVVAPDRRTALQRARFYHGPDVGVSAELSAAQAAREQLGAGRLATRAPRRDPRYRDYAAERRRDWQRRSRQDED
jgi:hypothetical protein